MASRLSFWAQNLNNTGDDIYSREGTLLQPHQQQEIEAVVGQISEVTSNGTSVGAAGSVRGTLLTKFLQSPCYVLHVTPREADVGGRTSPVACFGTFDGDDSAAWPRTVEGEIRSFCASIGRTLPDSFQHDLEQTLAALKKNASAAQLRLTVIVGAAVLLILLLIVIR